MTLLDFLIYYLNAWFETGNYKLRWNTPLSRSTLVTTVATFALLFTLEQLMQFYVFDTNYFGATNQIIYYPFFLIFALLINKIYDYIYIKKDRYTIVCVPKFNSMTLFSEQNGILIARAFITLSGLTPVILIPIFLTSGVK